MFTLVISSLTTFNLPWFMDLTFQVPMQYCSLQHQTLLPSPITSTWALFSLLLHLFILSGVISLLFFTLLLHWSYFSSSILGTYRPGEFIFQCHIFVISFRVMPFHTVHGVIKATILKWVAIPFSSGHVLSEFPPWPVCLGWPYMVWLRVSLS